MGDEEKLCKRNLTDKENGVKMKTRERNKWVRRQGLKFGRSHNPYPLHFKVS
jgi:hypothetical protein